MAQYDFQIADYERIFRKRYKIVLLSIILAVAFSVMFANMRVPLYRASATVKVDRTSLMGTAMDQMVYGTWDNIETQTKVLTSYPVLLRAGKILHLVPDTVKEDVMPTDDKLLSILEDLKSKISTDLNQGTNIIQITIVSSKPEEARDIANAIVFAYKDASLSEKKMHATKTKAFIEQQLEQCRVQLTESEHEVKSFEESQKLPSLDVNTRNVIPEFCTKLTTF